MSKWIVLVFVLQGQHENKCISICYHYLYLDLPFISFLVSGHSNTGLFVEGQVLLLEKASTSLSFLTSLRVLMWLNSLLTTSSFELDFFPNKNRSIDSLLYRFPSLQDTIGWQRGCFESAQSCHFAELMDSLSALGALLAVRTSSHLLGILPPSAPIS